MDRRMERLRNEIDRIDDSILQLFKERMHLVDRLTDEKMTARIPVTLPMREQAILLRIAEEAGPELAPYAKLLFMAMVAASRSWQTKRMRPKTGYLSAKIGQALRAMPDKLFPAGATVAGSGVRDSFSQTACEVFFSQVSLLHCKDDRSGFGALDKGLGQVGVVPIQSSGFGFVTEVYDLLEQYGFYIVRALCLDTGYSLFVKNGTILSQVEEIFAYARAMGECSAFLKTCPSAKVIVCDSNAQAVAQAAESERLHVGVIAPPAMAGCTGFVSIADRIENVQRGRTRFVCVSKDLVIYPQSKRTSLMLTAPSMQDAICVLAEVFTMPNVKVLNLQSRPDPNRGGEARIFMDMDASLDEPGMLSLLDYLK